MPRSQVYQPSRFSPLKSLITSFSVATAFSSPDLHALSVSPRKHAQINVRVNRCTFIFLYFKIIVSSDCGNMSDKFLLCQISKELHQNVGDFVRSLHFQKTGPRPPRLITTPFVMLGRGEISVVPIGQGHRKHRFDRTIFLQMKPDFYEHFAWNSGDSQLTNPERLQDHIHLTGILLD